MWGAPVGAKNESSLLNLLDCNSTWEPPRKIQPNNCFPSLLVQITMLCSYDYPLSKRPALCQRWVKKFLCSDFYLAPSSFLFPNCLFACFPLVWPWQSCNPTSSANVVPSFLALFLFCLLSSRWPNPCPHCLRCRIEWHQNQNFDRFLKFFLFFYDITHVAWSCACAFWPHS